MSRKLEVKIETMATQTMTINAGHTNGDNKRKTAVKIVFGAMTFGKEGMC